MYPVHYVPAGDVLPIFFDTYAGATGASITLTGLAVTDIEIYRDGSVTQRASDAGYTLLDTDGIDFDGITGIHGFSIDTGDNTDAGFYTVGAWFHVVVSAVTVDSQTVNFIAAAFRIMPAESSAAVPKVDVSHFGGTAGTFASGRPEVNTTHAAGTAWGSGAITAAVFAADAITAAKLASDVTTELQSGLATAAELAKVPKSDGTASWNATALAALQSEANDALVAYDAATGTDVTNAAANVSVDEIQATALADLFNTDSATTYASAVAGSVVKEIADNAGGSSLTLGDIADAVWDEQLTNAAHNGGNSAGRYLRTLAPGNGAIHEGTCQSGSAANTIVLDTGASSTNGTYDPAIVVLTGGTGAGQTRFIIDYVGSTRTATIARDWRTTPDNTSTFAIVPEVNLLSTNEGRAQGGGASTITLNASASAVNDTYNGQTVVLRTGAGQDQARLVVGYNGTTKVATVGEAWATQPDTTTGYMMLHTGRALVSGFVDNVLTAAAIAADVTTELQSGLATAAELAKVPKSDGTATWNATALASLQAEATDALNAYDPPTRAELTTDTNSVLTAVGDVPTNAELATALDPLPTAAENATALLGATVEGSTTVVQSMRLANAALGGKASGLETTTATYRDIADSKDRIVATVDADGNRTAVTRDLT